MRSRSTFRQLARTTAATALLLTVVAVAPVAGASDASTAVTTSTTDERSLQCESGVVTSPDGTETSSATLERVPAGTDAGPGCRFLEQ